MRGCSKRFKKIPQDQNDDLLDVKRFEWPLLEAGEANRAEPAHKGKAPSKRPMRRLSEAGDEPMVRT